MFLMLSATITGAIITYYNNAFLSVSSDAILTVAILGSFIPMLMDSGGNAGCQSSALMIRGIALGEIQFRNIFKVLWREVRVGFLCGLALGVVNFVRVYLMNGRDLLLCITVSVSLIVTVVIAKSIGCVLPLVAKKIRLDPALMAAPLITTIADASSLVVYFSIATALLQI
jgi:magnesium transporter